MYLLHKIVFINQNILNYLHYTEYKRIFIINRSAESKVMESETAIIQRDAAGNISIDENGFVTCISEGKSNYLSYKI